MTDTQTTKYTFTPKRHSPSVIAKAAKLMSKPVPAPKISDITLEQIIEVERSAEHGIAA